MAASYIPALLSKRLFSKSLTANFFENFLFNNYYIAIEY